MCKLLIVLVLGSILSGCASSKASRSLQVQKSYQPIISKTKPINGCRALKNGYLVCPKIARR